MSIGYRCECPQDQCIRTSTEEEKEAWKVINSYRKDGEYISFQECKWLKGASNRTKILREEDMFIVWKYVPRNVLGETVL